MNSIGEMQESFERLNEIHDAIERGFVSEVPEKRALFDEEASEEARKSAVSQSYLISDLIMEQVPRTERDVLIVMAHLVQKLDLMACGSTNADAERALKASQALLVCLEKGVGKSDEFKGWIAETITDSRRKVSFRELAYEI